MSDEKIEKRRKHPDIYSGRDPLALLIHPDTTATPALHHSLPHTGGLRERHLPYPLVKWASIHKGSSCSIEKGLGDAKPPVRRGYKET